MERLNDIHEPKHLDVDHGTLHPNGSTVHQYWSARQTLHVACAYSNPERWKSRLALMNDFRRHISGLPNVRLHVGELAYGDRPFEVTSAQNPDDLQLRTTHQLWHKENVLNLVIARFPSDWQYGAYCDSDVHFGRHDVALETIHQLQLHPWVQMFSSYANLGPDHAIMDVKPSFASLYLGGHLSQDDLRRASSPVAAYYPGGMETAGRLAPKNVMTTGLAWAFRRDAFRDCGGLLDCCILGSGDWHMSVGLVGDVENHPATAELKKTTPEYTKAIRVWQRRASLACRQDIGVVNCHALHGFHGPKDYRGYATRWKILSECKFDPGTDLFRDHQGLWQLSPERIELRDRIRNYFRARNEDAL